MPDPLVNRDSSPGEITLAGRRLNDLSPERIELPLVSLVLRNWNYAEFVGAAIDSIRAQDYPRFECIVVDNGSTDDSRDVIASHAGGDARFRIVHTGKNLGPMGGALAGLDLAKGEFVTFVDSDDFIFPSFVSAHVQVHLALSRSVALTSNTVVELNREGTIISGGQTRNAAQRPNGPIAGLRPPDLVPRLATVSDEQYSRLNEATFLHPPDLAGWLWGSGTANMFRRFVIDLVRPRGPEDTLFRLAADNHFCRLCHIVGGSGIIGTPLSARRIHDRNHFATAPTMHYIAGGGGPASQHIATRRHEKARVLLSQVEAFSWRIGSRLWTGLDQILDEDRADRRAEMSKPEMLELLVACLPQLFTAFGTTRTLRELRIRMGGRAIRRLLAEAYGGTPPAPLVWKLRRWEVGRFLGRKR